ncbi:unnamed protein product [Durusdinium trenchii]|uniref:Pentatricopeptide repeat-containing protein n=1 Tax=Durusdinium trenchii TaxID=1381693 RepID=A0ABP0SAZ6_9DINO
MEISPDLVTCNTLISACARETRWPDAINLLTSMEGRRVLPDLISFKTAITSCRKEGRWEEALELLSLMWQQRVAIDLITMNSAMTCTASAQQWKEVMVLFDSMRICKLSPDRLSYSTAMSACESWQRVLESLQNMLKLGVVDVTSWSSLLQTCREQREVGVSIIEALGMSQQDVVLTSATMDFWARIHQWAKALQLFTAMPHARIRPNVSDFTMAMLACSQSRLWQRALQLFRRMKDDLEGNLNIIAYNTAMGASLDLHPSRTCI